MKKRHTKFKILFSSHIKSRAEKYFNALKDTTGINLYSRKFYGKDKTRYYVREIVKQGVKK